MEIAVGVSLCSESAPGCESAPVSPDATWACTAPTSCGTSLCASRRACGPSISLCCVTGCLGAVHSRVSPRQPLRLPPDYIFGLGRRSHCVGRLLRSCCGARPLGTCSRQLQALKCRAPEPTHAWLLVWEVAGWPAPDSGVTCPPPTLLQSSGHISSVLGYRRNERMS